MRDSSIPHGDCRKHYLYLSGLNDPIDMFDEGVANLDAHQAVSIVCVLPNPLNRNPKTVNQKNGSKYSTTYERTL